MSTACRVIGSLVVMAALAGVPVAHGQQRVTAEQLAALRTSSTATLQRIGPRGVDTLRDDRDLTLARGEIIVAAPAADERRPVAHDSAGPGGVHLDASFPMIVSTRSGARTLFVTIQTGTGLQYLSNERAFVGDVHVGLEDRDAPLRRFELTDPVLLQTISMNGTVAPDTVRVRHTQVPLQRLRVTSSAPGDSVGIRILYANQQPVDVYIPVRRAQLVILPRRVRINGFGLEKARFNVVLPSELGTDSIPIAFSTRLQPEAHAEYAAAGRPASMRVQSRGLGDDTVWAAGPHFVTPAYASIEYATPWLFIAAALLGGMVGATIRENIRSRAASSRKRVASSAFAGILIGVLFGTAYAIGVNLLPIAISGPPVEAVIFVVAALAAFLGGAALRDRLSGPGSVVDRTAP